VDLVVISKILYVGPVQELGRETPNALMHVPIVLLILAALWRDRRPQTIEARARPTA
jgi:hypothetical protein